MGLPALREHVCEREPGPTASCSVQVTFHPTTVGPASASLELTDNSGTLDVPLSGVGITGALSATPNAIVFQPQPPGGGNQQLGVSIQDSAAAGVQATSATITGPDASRFSIGGGQFCATQAYVPGSSCMMSVGFDPSNGAGVYHAQLQISSDSQSSPLIIPLTATSLSGPTATPTPSQTDFGNVAIGSSSARTVAISNNGDYPLQVQGWFTSGGTPASFPVTADGCSGQQVDPGSSCPITVSFQPTAVGYRDATIILITSTKHGIVPIAFVGTGTPTLNGAATITGSPTAGSTLTCNPVGYRAGSSYQYQWLRASHPVAGADAPTFVPVDADVGHRFACRIATTNSVSTQAVTSPKTAPIVPMTLASSARSPGHKPVGPCTPHTSSGSATASP